MSVEIDKMFEFLGAVNLNPAIREYAELEAIKEWAIDSLGLNYTSGDQVVICSNVPFDIAMERESSGWNGYKAELQRGKRGRAGEIRFNTYHKQWNVLFTSYLGEDTLGNTFNFNVQWLQKARD
jgi:hypothetical protein